MVYPGKQFTEDAIKLIREELISLPVLEGLKGKLEELAKSLEGIKDKKTFLRTNRGARVAEGIFEKLKSLKESGDREKAEELFAVVEQEVAELVEKCRTMVIRMT